MTSKRLGLLAIVIAAAVIWAIPTASVGKPARLQRPARRCGRDRQPRHRRRRHGRQGRLQDRRCARHETRPPRRRQEQAPTSARPPTDPARQPPLHGSDPHAQGGVAVVDLNPQQRASARRQARRHGLRRGRDRRPRPRREDQRRLPRPHHDLIAARPEIAGVDSAQGETKNGPLQPIQTGILDPLCTNTGQQVCLAVLTADSMTTATGSDNDFAVARASVLGLGVGAAESHGTITEDAHLPDVDRRVARRQRRRSGRRRRRAGLRLDDQSKSCRGQAPSRHDDLACHRARRHPGAAARPQAARTARRTRSPASPACCRSSVTPRTSPVRLPCARRSTSTPCRSARHSLTEGDDGLVGGHQRGPGRRRDGRHPAVLRQRSTTTATASSTTPTRVATATATRNNADCYNPNDDDETDRSGDTRRLGRRRRRRAVRRQPRQRRRRPRRRARTRAATPTATPNNPDSYDPTDDSEGRRRWRRRRRRQRTDGGQSTDDSALPFTGTDVVGLALAGLLMLAGGLLLRRREDTHPRCRCSTGSSTR